MAPKKGKPKSGKKIGKYVSTLPPFDYQPPSVHDMGYQAPQYVKCRIRHKSVTSSPLNFEWPAVPTDAVTLAMVKDAISKRHCGATPDLVLYKDQVKEECSLKDTDDGTTFRQLGVMGAAPGTATELPVFTLFYDFSGKENPIILVDAEPLQSKYGINMKLFRSLEHLST